MALESQGVLIRRESSVAGTTAALTADTGIGFVAAATAITRQGGWGGFDPNMRIVVTNSASNDGVYTVKGGTGTTALTVHEPVALEASGAAITIAGHTMQNIGQIVSFNGPSMSAAVIDVTNLQSTAKEKLVGVYDGGQISMSVILDNESSNAVLHLQLEDDMRARTKRHFDIRFTETATIVGSVYCEGYVTGFTVTGSVDNALKADITLTVSTGVYFAQPV